MSSDVTDQSLLRRCQILDQSAWQRFNDIYGPLIENWLKRRGIPHDLAEDVRQETLLKVFHELSGFNHNGREGAFRNWLRQVMHFRLRTRQRQQWTRKEDAQPDWSVVVDALADEHSEISKLWNHEHDTYLVKRLLELVSKEFSLSTMEAFQRVVLRGEDVTAVAQSLQMTPNAVRIAQSRVLAALRRVGAGLID